MKTRVSLRYFVNDCRSHTLLRNLWQCTKFARMIKISQVLVFHFTKTFSGCLQRRIEKLIEHLQWSFFSEILNGFKLLTIFAKESSVADV